MTTWGDRPVPKEKPEFSCDLPYDLWLTLSCYHRARVYMVGANPTLSEVHAEVKHDPWGQLTQAEVRRNVETLRGLGYKIELINEAKRVAREPKAERPKPTRVAPDRPPASDPVQPAVPDAVLEGAARPARRRAGASASRDDEPEAEFFGDTDALRAVVVKRRRRGELTGPRAAGAC